MIRNCFECSATTEPWGFRLSGDLGYSRSAKNLEKFLVEPDILIVPLCAACYQSLRIKMNGAFEEFRDVKNNHAQPNQ